MNEKIVVCGASGYVGRHLVADLVRKGYKNVVAVSRRFGRLKGATCFQADLRNFWDCKAACEGATQVYNLAATVGGIGFISANRAQCMTNAAININLLRVLEPGAKYFFASSSCVYPSSAIPLQEWQTYPQFLTGYGLEKYFSEQTALAFAEERGIPVRIARLHTVAGPGDFRGPDKDHFPSALAEKVVAAKLSGKHEIQIWGNGEQTRSLLYIDDAVEGIQRIMNGSESRPFNLASSEVVSVNGIVDMLEEISAVKLTRFYSELASIGCQNKTANMSALRAAFGWEPMTPTRTVMERIYGSAWERATIG